MIAVGWLIVMALLLVVEIATLGLTTIWFAAGALVAFLAALLNLPFWFQMILFLAVSIVLLFFTRPLAARYLNSRTTKTNAESLVGRSAIVTKDIDNLLAQGQVKVGGMEWTARATRDDIKIHSGATVVIEGISGVKLIEQVLHAVVSVVAAWFLIVKGPEYGAAGGTLGTCLGALGGLIFVMIVYHLYKPTIYKLLKRDASKHLYSTNHVMKLVTMTMAPVILSSTIYQISGIVDSSMFSKIMGGLGYADDVATSLFGIYSGQYQMIINIPLGITSSIGIALIPTITKVLTLGRYQEARNKIDSVLKLTNVLSIPCFVGLAVLAEPIMKLLFVVKNDVPANLLMLGGVTVVLYSFSTVTIAVLQGIGKMKTPVINAAISLGIHIIFVFILLQFADMNIYALVYGNIVFSFAMCGLNLVALYRYIGYRQEILHSFVLPGAASAIMGAIVYFIYKGSYFLIHSNLVSVMISVVAGVAAYGIALILMGGISEEEMYSLPKGSVLVRLCRKFHML